MNSFISSSIIIIIYVIYPHYRHFVILFFSSYQIYISLNSRTGKYMPQKNERMRKKIHLRFIRRHTEPLSIQIIAKNLRKKKEISEMMQIEEEILSPHLSLIRLIKPKFSIPFIIIIIESVDVFWCLQIPMYRCDRWCCRIPNGNGIIYSHHQSGA